MDIKYHDFSGPVIVVGTDGSRTATAAVRAAALAACRDNATLHVVHAWQRVWTDEQREAAVHAPSDVSWATGPEGEAQLVLAEAEQLVEDLDPTMVVHTRRGSVSGALRTVAEETGASLILVGNQRIGTFSPATRLRFFPPCQVHVMDTDPWATGRRDPRAVPEKDLMRTIPAL